MSCPDNLTKREEEAWDRAMRHPIPKGTIVTQLMSEKFRTLEDSTAHGCPLVEFISGHRKGQKTHVTLYLHREFVPHYLAEIDREAAEGENVDQT